MRYSPLACPDHWRRSTLLVPLRKVIATVEEHEFKRKVASPAWRALRLQTWGCFGGSFQVWTMNLEIRVYRAMRKRGSWRRPSLVRDLVRAPH